ncbi:MAG: CDP-alcohol phosphatidyltransferase family protein [Candidatus Poseidoniaceae archaeon]
MALEQLRNRWERALPPLIRRLDGISVDALTWSALPAGVGGAYLMATATNDQQGALMLLGGAALMALAMLLDGLDGAVARARGQVSRWGDMLDHTIDRLLDAVWVFALAFNPAFCGQAALGWAAAWFTLLGSYMGTQAQAVTGLRNYRGFSRADRMVLTLVSLVLTAALIPIDAAIFGSVDVFGGVPITAMSLMVVVSMLGGVWTFLTRFRQAAGDVRRMDAQDPLPQPGASDE